jgi:hypothetical protein
MQQHAQQSFARNPGPHSYAAIVHGFHDHLIRPVGGGRNGSIFGSFLPAPTGHASAYALGTSSKLT